MQLVYTLGKRRYQENPESSAELQRAGLANSSLHKDVQKRIRNVERVIGASLRPFRLVARGFCLLAFALLLALVAVGLYAATHKFSGKTLHKSRQLQDRPHGPPFWQCKVDPKSNWTVADLHCIFAHHNSSHGSDWDLPSVSSPFDNENSFNSSFSYWNQSNISNFNGSFNSTFFGSENPNSRLLMGFNGFERHMPFLRNASVGYHHHGHHHFLFLTINDHPFFLAPPPPMPLCVYKLIFGLSIALSHTLLALLIVICCKCKHHRRMNAQIERMLADDNAEGGIIVQCEDGFKRLRVFVPVSAPPAMHHPIAQPQVHYPTLNTQEPLRREVPEVKRTKKMKYILVEDDSQPETSLPFREDHNMRN